MTDKRLARALVATVILVGACAKKVKDPVEDLARRLGPETAGVMVLNHLDVALPVVQREIKFFHLDEKLAEMSAKAGRPLFSATDWEASGVDLTRPMVMAYIGPLRGIAVEIPVRDGKALVAAYRENLARQAKGLTMRSEKVDGHDAWIVAGKRDEGAFAFDGDVAVVAIAADSADPQATLARLLGKHEGESLAADLSFRALRADAGAATTLLGWISPTVMAMASQLPKTPGMAFNVDWMAALHGLAVGITVDDKIARVRYATEVKGVKLEGLVPVRGGTKVLDRIAGTAWAAGRYEIVVDEALRNELLSSEMGKLMLRSMEQSYANMGITVDLAKDVLPLLPTKIAFSGILLATPSARSAKEMEWLSFIDVADVEKARAFAAKIGARTIDAAGTKWTITGHVAMGVLDGKLVVATGADPAATLARAFAPGGPRAIASVPANIRDEIHDGPAMTGWMRLEMFGAMIGIGPQFAGEFTAGGAHRGDVDSMDVGTTWDTIHEIARMVPAVKESFDDTEPRADLDRLASLAIVAHTAGRKFPPATAWTPPGSACDRPDHKFPVDPKTWSGAPWAALSFVVGHPSDVQYRIVASDDEHFVVEAQRDLWCSGGKLRWRGGAHVEGGVTVADPIAPTDATAP